MTYREFRFLCKSQHQSKHWCWNNTEKIRCKELGCKRWAYRTLSSLHKTSAEPTVYYTDASGNLFVPGDAQSRRLPKGVERHEIRTFRDRDRFYKMVNTQERVEREKMVEGEENLFGSYRSHERAQLFHDMRNMSEYGRAMAQAAMDRNNQRSGEGYESRFYIEGWENDHRN